MAEKDAALFSRAYLRPASSQPDSQRFRTRLFAAWDDLMTKDDRENFFALARSELGVTIRGNDFGAFYGTFFERGELRDILDAISLTLRILAFGKRSDDVKHFSATVRRIFREEALGYVLNEYGAVRYLVDEEFERTRTSLIDGLGAGKLTAVRAAVENAFAKLDREPFATKEAVRSMFEGVETLCKVLGEHHDDLSEGMVKKRIKPMVGRVYGALDSSAQSFAEQTVEGLIKWINAGHRYRHGQNTTEPQEPPLELAIAFLSQGAAFIRFLIDLNARAVV